MSLVELLSHKNSAARPCVLGLIMEKLPTDERKSLEDALENNSISTAFIHNALLQEGYALAYSTVGTHRRARCKCNVSG